MIAVLSDDFSGAAELLACLGAAHGLGADVWIGEPGSYPWPAWALPHRSLCP